MSDFKILTRKTTTTQFFTNPLLSNFGLICYSIFSHPLYFSYFIFFSPYLLNLLYFLWPLFITILLVAFTLSTSLDYGQEGDDGQEGGDQVDDIYRFVEVEAYRILFESVSYEVEDSSNDPVEELKFMVFEDAKCSFEEDPVEIISPSGCTDDVAVEEDKNCVEDFVKDISIDEIDEKTNHEGDEKEVIESSLDLVKVQEKVQLIRSKSKIELNVNDAEQFSLKNRENAGSLSTKSAGWAKQNDGKLGSNGSMRVLDREWKRTLACKLYEERHNVGEEGMDSLWEMYDTDTSKVHHPAAKKNMKKGLGFNEGDDGDEEEELAVQLCCLEALKISSGKMNLGMKKPSLLRFSKALKGLGWLHNASNGSSSSTSSSKNGKKAVRN